MKYFRMVYDQLFNFHKNPLEQECFISILDVFFAHGATENLISKLNIRLIKNFSAEIVKNFKAQSEDNIGPIGPQITIE